MLNVNRTLATFALTLIMILSMIPVLSVRPITAQSPDSKSKELMQVTNAHLTISHYGSSCLVMPLEKGDHIECNYVVSNIFYYPKWPSIDLKAYVYVKDPNNTNIYDIYTNTTGSFIFTATQSGNYTFFAASSLVDQLFGKYYLTTTEINEAKPLEITLNYTITGAPLKISITSPIIQTSLQSNVSISFSFSRVYTWAGYSLNGGDVMSLCDGNYGNISLTNLSDGQYTLTLYANDSYGNMASKAAAFTVGSPVTTSPVPMAASPLPLLPIIAAVSLVIVLLLVAIFFKRLAKSSNK